MLPGTLVWSSPISPAYANSNLAYLSKLYNTWGGGIDYLGKVGGTGFHAGALAFVRLPPNYDPHDLQSLADITVWDTQIIDPKQLELISKHVPDQRNILYHYMDDIEGQPKSQSIGGYIAIYVLMQLNTSSSGQNQIDVEILSKASEDFTLAQMRNPTSSGVTVDFSGYQDLINSRLYPAHTDAFSNSPLTYLNFTTRTSIPNVGLRNIEGDFDGSVPCPAPTYKDGETIVPGWAMSYNVNSNKYALPLQLFDTEFRTYCSSNPSASIILRGGHEGVHIMPQTMCTPHLDDRETMASFNICAADSGVAPATAFTDHTYFTMDRYYVDVIDANGVEQIVVPVPGEAFVLFRIQSNYTGDENNNVLSSSEVQRAFTSGKLPAFGRNEAILFQLVDSKTRVPITGMKLYYEGFFTAPIQVADADINLSDVSLIYQSIIPRNTPISTPPSAYLQAKSQTTWLKQQLQKRL